VRRWRDHQHQQAVSENKDAYRRVQINENSDNTAAFLDLVFPRKMIITPVWVHVVGRSAATSATAAAATTTATSACVIPTRIHTNKTTSFLER
jgi:hypothetical protein